ncbi:FAD-dependent monooxygenase [Streptomyces sp. DSM 44917]|uniref:FAD-dependent monooxygenase n=1 Tax=Streptomyces boetiae TaxID=3075541 RepID=A0ABU2L4I8_9ACTN|nr:FAD-dependent monooxygenase [Streptomyces sp. DSM 44917]MDT0306468.1 FAD-dependent monooxygenase [Streptomyces sp. DSM 44917]
MKAVIVGAGIGGLTAALALRTRGIAVTVLEQAGRLGEIGAGLQIGPNASRVLYRLGLAEALAPVSLVVEESVRRRWSSGEILAKTTLGPGAAARFGAPYLHLHRADLHRVLHEAAIDPRRPGPVVRVETGRRVVGLEDAGVRAPAVVTEDGSRFGGDLVIGADGIRSRVRRLIGAPDEVHHSGDMAYRTLIRRPQVARDPVTRWFFDWPAANFWLGENRHLVAYPVRGMEFVNIVAIVPIGERVREELRAEVPAAEMRAHYEGWDERVVRLLGYSDERVVAWALNYQTPFPRWHRGHVALLGDACHAMLPYFSQGASQAIEDGAVLGEQVAKAALGKLSVAEALAGYSARRAEHAGVVQNGALNNRALFHLPDGPEQRRRDEKFRRHHQESDVSFDWIYEGTPLEDDLVGQGA